MLENMCEQNNRLTELLNNFIEDLINFISNDVKVGFKYEMDNMNNIDNKNLIERVFVSVKDENISKPNNDELLKITASKMMI